LAKQPAVILFLVLLAVKVQKNRKVSRDMLSMSFAFFAALSPYILYNLAFQSQSFLGGHTSRLALAFSEEGNRQGLGYIADEISWGMSPLVAFVSVSSILYMIYERRRRDAVVVFSTIAFGIFFLFYNKHSYYALPLAPFFAVATAATLARLKTRRLMLAATFIILGCGLFESTLMLCGNKYGFEAYRRIPENIGQGDAVIVFGDLIRGNYLKALMFYNRGQKLTYLGDAGVGPDSIVRLDYGRPTYYLIHASEADPKYQKALGENAIYSDKYALVMFGTVFYRAPANVHFFSRKSLQTRDAPAQTGFGIVRLGRIPELYLVKLGEGQEIMKKPDGTYAISGGGA
jgi:hypothetical protein